MTVYCGYCGKRGHNRLGCPERKKDARENPEGYIAKQLERERLVREAAVRSRSCSYCDKQGHNRRGCPELKADRLKIQTLQDQYLDKFTNTFARHGLGPGSLVSVPYGSDRSVLMIVTGFNWSHIDFLNDTLDLNREYGLGNRNVLACRVVSTSGFTDEGGYWDSPPRHNDLKHLSYEYFTEMLEEIQSGTRMEMYTHKQNITIVGKMKNQLIEKPPGTILTHHIISRFNLQPAKNASDWEKKKLNPDNEAWGQYQERNEYHD